MYQDLLYVTAQPDVPYFHWQAEVYIHNFIEKGINPKNIHVVFSINPNTKPSESSLRLKEFGVNVHHYEDTRTKKYYIPSIKPYLISKWLEENPSYGKVFFLHDADIIFRELPDYKTLLQDDILYVSDTIGYIGYDYIMDCCKRYESHHPSSQKGQLLQEMADVVGIDVTLIKDNQLNSGGGQYIIKDTDHILWNKIYEDCVPLYNQMLDYQKRFPISPGEIQFWTAEMWSVLWNLWRVGKQTKIHDELSFSWATDTTSMYEKHPILHMAGITENLRNTKFYKGDFIMVNPLDKLREDLSYFNYVENHSATKKYVEVMVNLVKKTTF